MARYTKTGTPNTIGQLNAELDLIAIAIGDTFSRKGDVPNQVETTIDANSNRVINVAAPVLNTDAARLQDITDALGKGSDTATLFSKYNLSDLIEVLYDKNLGIGIWAHRGLKNYAPENTIAAVYNATNKGHTAVEGDITWTSDNVAIIMHDTTVTRTTDGTGNVADKTLAQIEALDAGSWFSSIYKNEKVPTFEEWFDAIVLNGSVPVIEIKEGGNGTQQNIQALATRCVAKSPRNRYAYLVRNETTFGYIRNINPFANIVYFPNVSEPSTTNADFVEKQGNCSLHLAADYSTSFDFTPYSFPITALNQPNTQDLRKAILRGFSLIGTDSYIGSNI